MKPILSDETMVVTLRVADLREIVRAVVTEALGEQAQHALLDLKQVSERYRVGREALLGAAKRGEIELSQGPRRKFLVRAGELERWLTERKYTPPRARFVAKDLEEWEREATRQLEEAATRVRTRESQKAMPRRR